MISIEIAYRKWSAKYDTGVENYTKQNLPFRVKISFAFAKNYPKRPGKSDKKSDQESISEEKLTLGEYLAKNKLSKPFIDYHIIPMVSAIWSMPPLEASKMPISFFLKFFQNHGLFKLKNIMFKINI